MTLSCSGQRAEAFWRQLIESYSDGASLSDLRAAREEEALSLLSGLFSSYGRVGSNSFAVAPKPVIVGRGIAGE